MSYRSIKRVFGETQLELKLLFLFGVGLLAVIVTSFWWYGRQTAELVYDQNRNTGRLLVDQHMLKVHWGEMGVQGRSKRPAMQGNSVDQPDPELQRSRNYVEHMEKILCKQPNTVTLIRPYRTPNPNAPDKPNKEKEFEQGLIERFLKAPPATTVGDEPIEFEEYDLPDEGKYQYFEPIRAKPSCLAACHAPPPGGQGIDAAGSGVAMTGESSPPGAPQLRVGDVMAIAKVTIPNGPTQSRLDWNWAILWATAILAVFLALVTSYAIVRYVIVKPLRHLRDVSDSISRGNVTQRADIRTGDEFEELAKAFNRMLRHLITAQQDLRQANSSLDSKVDELAQANMQLYELNTIKSDFLATMSHELRTPLNSILGFSEVLGSIDALDDRQKRYVQNIQKSGRTLLDMINDILDLAKMESGRMNLRLTDFRVAQVVAAQCDMARPLAEKKNLDVEAVIEPELPPMRQDQARVQQILNNLLSNAIKFTPEGGRVTVLVRRNDEDFLVMEVCDTGVGIAEEDQQIIFEKFRQGRVGVPSGDAMTREYSGSGLGLSIVKELCKLLGGEVSVVSQLGKGSTFTVRLPWTLQDPSHPEMPLVESLDALAKPRYEYARDDGRAQ